MNGDSAAVMGKVLNNLKLLLERVAGLDARLVALEQRTRGGGEAPGDVFERIDEVERRLGAALAIGDHLQSASRALAEAAGLLGIAADAGAAVAPAAKLVRPRSSVAAGLDEAPRRDEAPPRILVETRPARPGIEAVDLVARNRELTARAVDPFGTEQADRIADEFERFVNSNEIRRGPQEFQRWLEPALIHAPRIEVSGPYWYVALEGQPPSRCFVLIPPNITPTATYPNLHTFFSVKPDLPSGHGRLFILERAAVWNERTQGGNPLTESVEKGVLRIRP